MNYTQIDEYCLLNEKYGKLIIKQMKSSNYDDITIIQQELDLINKKIEMLKNVS